MEKLNFIIDFTKKKMQKALNHLENSFNKIQAGKPSPMMLDDISLDYYGKLTYLNKISHITIPNAKTITIHPFDKSIIKSIEKAIINSNLGLLPNNNGENITINIPPLSEERRKKLSKQAKQETENTKVSIRNYRKEANNEIKKTKDISKDLIIIYEKKIQKLTDIFIKKIEEYFNKKNSNIMKI